MTPKTDEELIDHMAPSGRSLISRARSVSEVGTRPGPESLYRLDTEEIWDVIDSNWTEWGKQKAEMVYILCRKGVPKHRIGDVWYNLSKLIPNTKFIMCTKERTASQDHYCLFHQLCELSSPFEQQILADVHRTFPDQEVSSSEDFQKSLYNVLKAYSLYDEGVGYCQGLSFVAALLLMKVPEEQAFYILARLMRGHDLRSIYTEDMRGVQLRMFQMNKLVQQLFPALYKHMEALEVKISLILIPWFMTAFCYQLPLAVAFRVMDSLLLEGIPALFRVALSILLMCEADVMGLDEQGIMEYFRSDLRSKFNDPQQLMNIAYAVNVSVPQLEQMELEFIQTEKNLPTPSPSPFVDESYKKWSAEKIHVNQILVENHELREKNRQQAEELQALQASSEQYKKKMEAEKINLLRRLTLVNESLEIALAEKKEMREKMGRSEKDLDNMQANIKDLMTANVALSEELRHVRPPTPTNPGPATTTSLSAPSSPVLLSPSFSFRRRNLGNS
jgi:Holliday junction resolvase RusA-like endonuclease